MKKKGLTMLVAAMVITGLICVIGSAAAVPTIRIGGNVPDEVELRGRNLPGVTLGMGTPEEVVIGGHTITATRPTVHLGGNVPDEVELRGRNLPGVTLGMGTPEEVRIGGQAITKEELAEKIAALLGGQ